MTRRRIVALGTVLANLMVAQAAHALFFFSSSRRHTRWPRDWSSDVCSSDLLEDDLAGAVEDLGVVVREDERRVPVEAMLGPFFPLFHATFALALEHVSRPDRRLFAGFEMAAPHAAVLHLVVDKVGVRAIDGTLVA